MLLVQRMFASGGPSGQDYPVFTQAPTTNGSVAIGHPIPGYIGTLNIYMVGSTSLTGSFLDNASDAAYNGTGQGAVWTYSCLGSETSFTLTQENLDSTNTTTTIAQLKLIINGGVNNGKYLVVGSGRGNATSWGHGGACQDVVASSTLTTATLIANGGNRVSSTTTTYSDATSYSPDVYASYGATEAYYSMGNDTQAIHMNYITGNGFGMRYRASSGAAYNVNSQTTNSYVVGAGRLALSGTTTGFGCALLVFKNDV